MGAEIHIAKGSALLKLIDLSWAAIEAEGEPIDLDKVRNLKFKKELGSEADGEDEEHKKSTKPFLKSRIDRLQLRAHIIRRVEPLLNVLEWAPKDEMSYPLGISRRRA